MAEPSGANPNPFAEDIEAAVAPLTEWLWRTICADPNHIPSAAKPSAEHIALHQPRSSWRSQWRLLAQTTRAPGTARGSAL